MESYFVWINKHEWQKKIVTNLERNHASVTKKSELNFNDYFIPDLLNFGRAPDFSKIGQLDPGVNFNPL